MAGSAQAWPCGWGSLLGGRAEGRVGVICWAGGALLEMGGEARPARAWPRCSSALLRALPQPAEVLLGATGIMRLAPVTPVDVRKWGSVKIAWLVARRLAVTSRQRRRVSIRAPGLAPIWTGRLGAMRKRGHGRCAGLSRMVQGARGRWVVGS